MASQEPTNKPPEVEVPIYGEIVGTDTPIAEFKWDGKDRIQSLARINIFVGANNSGKSRALRAIFQSKLPYVTNLMPFENIKKIASDFIKDIKDILGSGLKLKTFDFTKIEEYVEDYNTVSNTKSDQIIFNQYFNDILERFEILSKDSLQFTNGSVSEEKQELAIENVKNIIREKYCAELERSIANNTLKFQKRFYIPVLRGMRPFAEKDYYLERTKNDYFPDEKIFDSNNDPIKNSNKLRIGNEIFTGFGMYQDLKNKLLGKPEGRDTVRAYEEWLSNLFFSGNRITLIPAENDPGVVYIEIENENYHPIYNLGDGIQNLIILTYKMFTEENCMFFIEEPELFMHPGMQKIFMEVLISCKKHQFFLVTHSNHILDMSFDHKKMSIFHFSKSIENENLIFNVRNVSNEGQRVLKDLGVQNSSVFLSNSTIWVEGVTDRKYIKFFMEKYLSYLENPDNNGSENHKRFSKFNEDLHYSFVEYQGSGLAHWDFTESKKPKAEEQIENENTKSTKEKDRIKAGFVCANAFVIADGDVDEKRRGRELKMIISTEKLFVFPFKEIENMLPVSIIRKFVSHIWKTGKNSNNNKKPRKKPKQKPDTALISAKKYQESNVGLGKYLDGLYPPSSFYGATSGTLHRKEDLPDYCINYFSDYKLDTVQDKIIIELCKKIFSHIAECNGDNLE
jgi:predicted ATP-dependent endonuclease of OLD family